MGAWWLLQKAQAYAARGGWRCAAALYAQVPGAGLWRAVALAEVGKFEEARELLARNKASPSADLFLARVLFDSGDSAAAHDVLSSLVGREPNQHAGALLAACLLRLGRIPEARQLFREGLPHAPWALARLLLAVEEVVPDAPEPPFEPLPEIPVLEQPARSATGRHVRRGLALLRNQKWQEAFLAFRDAYSGRPDDPRVGYGLGVSLYYLGHHEQSQNWLEPVLAKLAEPFAADALATLGKVDLELGRPQQAILRLRRAIAAGAALEENFYALGLALLRTGRRTLARRSFEKCASLDLIRARWTEGIQ